MSDVSRLVRSTDSRFVWDPGQERWLRPWSVATYLNMPGIPRRWHELTHNSVEDRVYSLTTQEGGGIARWVKFRVSAAGWEILDRGNILWATNYMDLDQYGRRLEGYNPHRRKDPDRKVEKNLLWQVHEIGLKDALVSLPEVPNTTYAVQKRYLQFLEAEPTPLERRLQEINLLDDQVPNGHPLKYTGYLLEKGHWKRYVLGYGGQQTYVYRRFETWEDLRQRNGLSVDEALIAIQVGLSRMPEDGPTDDPTYFASRERIEKWSRGFWTESEMETIRAMRGLYQLELDLVEAAMRAVDSFREFLTFGGSAVLPEGVPTGMC